jgi:dTDP-4-dehydrorhamnose reductase
VTILVIGRSGQVARALLERSRAHHLPLIFMGREALDLSDTTAIEAAIERVSPQAIINAAAYTAVDAAETDQDAARAINVTGPAFVAEIAAKRQMPFVHLSTDYVFDGTKAAPYLESDPTNPLNMYGLTKRDGEELILAHKPDAVILRTSWVYSPYGKNFLRTMLSLAQTRDSLSIVDDQIGAPTSALDIASACISIIDAKLSGHQGRGIFHMTGGGETSWAGFAQAAFDHTALWRNGKVPAITPIPTADYPTPARRPLNSRLNCDLLEARFGIRLPAWDKSMRETLEVLRDEFGVTS